MRLVRRRAIRGVVRDPLPVFKLAGQCATEGLDHVRFLARLVELELTASGG